jgi:uncharacterized membrane protein
MATTVRLRNVIERVRDSQFFVPAIAIVGTVLLAVVTNALDEAGAPPGFLIPATAAAARTLLATVAGAIITVAALVFSFTAVTVQLAASQYSPRIVQEFVRDRAQQAVVGLVMGTFAFALASLPTVGSSGVDTARADWTATAAVLLGIASAVAIVWFIDHITRRIRIDDTVRRIAERTVDAFSAKPQSENADDGWNLLPETASDCVRATTSGFVQAIDVAALVASLPSGMVARVDTWIGHFVAEGNRVVTYWTASEVEPPEGLEKAITIGETRTVEQDPGLGIRQLVDVALRALSPGVNDPATAADVARQLAVCIRASYLAGDVDRVYVSGNGARLVAPHAPTTSHFVEVSFRPIRRAAADQPMVLEAIVESLRALGDELAELDRDHSRIDAEAVAAAEDLAAALDRD